MSLAVREVCAVLSKREREQNSSLRRCSRTGRTALEQLEQLQFSSGSAVLSDRTGDGKNGQFCLPEKDKLFYAVRTGRRAEKWAAVSDNPSAPCSRGGHVPRRLERRTSSPRASALSFGENRGFGAVIVHVLCIFRPFRESSTFGHNRRNTRIISTLQHGAFSHA